MPAENEVDNSAGELDKRLAQRGVYEMWITITLMTSVDFSKSVTWRRFEVTWRRFEVTWRHLLPLQSGVPNEA